LKEFAFFTTMIVFLTAPVFPAFDIGFGMWHDFSSNHVELENITQHVACMPAIIIGTFGACGVMFINVKWIHDNNPTILCTWYCHNRLLLLNYLSLIIGLPSTSQCDGGQPLLLIFMHLQIRITHLKTVAQIESPKIKTRNIESDPISIKNS